MKILLKLTILRYFYRHGVNVLAGAWDNGKTRVNPWEVERLGPLSSKKGQKWQSHLSFFVLSGGVSLRNIFFSTLPENRNSSDWAS